jgi:hypothetical protein
MRRANALSSTTEADVQRLVDTTPQTAFYFSAPWALYRTIYRLHARYSHPMPDKSQTYRVEGVKAELRHDLSCLARQSRSFSRRFLAPHRSSTPCDQTLCLHLGSSLISIVSAFPNTPAHRIHFVHL